MLLTCDENCICIFVCIFFLFFFFFFFLPVSLFFSGAGHSATLAALSLRLLRSQAITFNGADVLLNFSRDGTYTVISRLLQALPDNPTNNNVENNNFENAFLSILSLSGQENENNDDDGCVRNDQGFLALQNSVLRSLDASNQFGQPATTGTRSTRSARSMPSSTVSSSSSSSQNETHFRTLSLLLRIYCLHETNAPRLETRFQVLVMLATTLRTTKSLELVTMIFKSVETIAIAMNFLPRGAFVQLCEEVAHANRLAFACNVDPDPDVVGRLSASEVDISANVLMEHLYQCKNVFISFFPLPCLLFYDILALEFLTPYISVSHIVQLFRLNLGLSNVLEFKPDYSEGLGACKVMERVIIPLLVLKCDIAMTTISQRIKCLHLHVMGLKLLNMFMIHRTSFPLDGTVTQRLFDFIRTTTTTKRRSMSKRSSKRWSKRWSRSKRRSSATATEHPAPTTEDQNGDSREEEEQSLLIQRAEDALEIFVSASEFNVAGLRQYIDQLVLRSVIVFASTTTSNDDDSEVAAVAAAAVTSAPPPPPPSPPPPPPNHDRRAQMMYYTLDAMMEMNGRARTMFRNANGFQTCVKCIRKSGNDIVRTTAAEYNQWMLLIRQVLKAMAQSMAGPHAPNRSFVLNTIGYDCIADAIVQSGILQIRPQEVVDTLLGVFCGVVEEKEEEEEEEEEKEEREDDDDKDNDNEKRDERKGGERKEEEAAAAAAAAASATTTTKSNTFESMLKHVRTVDTRQLNANALLMIFETLPHLHSEQLSLETMHRVVNMVKAGGIRCCDTLASAGAVSWVLARMPKYSTHLRKIACQFIELVASHRLNPDDLRFMLTQMYTTLDPRSTDKNVNVAEQLWETLYNVVHSDAQVQFTEFVRSSDQSSDGPHVELTGGGGGGGGGGDIGDGSSSGSGNNKRLKMNGGRGVITGLGTLTWPPTHGLTFGCWIRIPPCISQEGDSNQKHWSVNIISLNNGKTNEILLSVTLTPKGIKVQSGNESILSTIRWCDHPYSNSSWHHIFISHKRTSKKMKKEKVEGTVDVCFDGAPLSLGRPLSMHRCGAVRASFCFFFTCSFLFFSFLFLFSS